jgi:hypothetical protein
MGSRGSSWVAWGMCVASVVLAALTWLLHAQNAAVPLPATAEPVSLPPLFAIGVLLVFALPGALIVSRRPRNPVGWLLAAIGYGLGLGNAAYEYGFYALITNPGSLPGGVPVLWLGDTLSFVFIWGPIPLLLLLFPDGRAPSPAWRPVVWMTLPAVGLLAVGAALFGRHLGGDPRLPLNPTARPAAADTISSASRLGAVVLLLLALASLSAVGVRFQHAKGAERQQLKWFAYGAAVLVLTLIGFLPLAWSSMFAPILAGFGVFTACVTVAMLRYHLYDIDRLINRTLVYGLLSALLAGVYAAVVVLLGQLFGRVGAEPPSWAVAGATLAVAALFHPARRRIQAVVDRHFNRRKYDAAKTIEAFSMRLREQVDLDTLSAELLAVVDQTVQPTTASLWLRPSTPARASGRQQGG